MTIAQMSDPLQHEYVQCCCSVVHNLGPDHCWWCLKPRASHAAPAKASEEAGA